MTGNSGITEKLHGFCSKDLEKCTAAGEVRFGAVGVELPPSSALGQSSSGVEGVGEGPALGAVLTCEEDTHGLLSTLPPESGCSHSAIALPRADGPAAGTMYAQMPEARCRQGGGLLP